MDELSITEEDVEIVVDEQSGLGPALADQFNDWANAVEALVSKAAEEGRDARPILLTAVNLMGEQARFWQTEFAKETESSTANASSVSG